MLSPIVNVCFSVQGNAVDHNSGFAEPLNIGGATVVFPIDVFGRRVRRFLTRPKTAESIVILLPLLR